jgi:hypothetical protein
VIGADAAEKLRAWAGRSAQERLFCDVRSEPGHSDFTLKPIADPGGLIDGDGAPISPAMFLQQR